MVRSTILPSLKISMVWSGFRHPIILQIYKYDTPGLVNPDIISWCVLNLDWSGLVLFPYLRQKVERMFLVAREEVADSLAGRYKRIFVQLYPYLHLLLDSLDICKIYLYSTLTFYSEEHSLSGFLLRFSLSEEGKHHSLLSYLIGKTKIILLAVRNINFLLFQDFTL